MLIWASPWRRWNIRDAKGKCMALLPSVDAKGTKGQLNDLSRCMDVLVFYFTVAKEN